MMQALRQAAFLARLVLAWFALTIGVAIASPIVSPQSMDLVCSGAGAVKLLVKTNGGSVPAGGHSLDCPLCISMAAPPPTVQALPATSLPSEGVTEQIPVSRVALRPAAPLPARGPPALQHTI